ncbi:uncharacterized protein LOC123258163 [Drosophila ananassae]|uniref:uncharacterized protein LOC123258163 n=1 Tax=Drosophila ananassae TaxID=7217 RepID=UPI001CFF82D2|nr:uncharacterized protein LOC123258163 [Drosophila ananassae]
MLQPRLEEPRQIRRYKPLPAVLFHFREGAVGVCGDIKEMFHQVLIRPEDRCSQRFLWRDGNDDRDPDVYEMNVMTFGAACSPSTAHFVKTVNALKFRDSDPRTVKAIIDHHYVDDYVDSFALESEVIAVSTRVKEIHAELCQFLSSSPIVKVALGPPGQVKSVGWGEAEQKILGMRWQVATDDFRFNVEYHRVPKSVLSGDRVPTKREYLSLLMSTFDPLGFLCCLKITAKLLLREIWKQKIQWDEPLPEEKAEPLLPDAERWTPWDSSDVLATILGLEQFEPLSCMCSWMQPASGWPSPEEGTEHVPDAPDEEEMPSEFALVASNEFVSPFQRFSSFCRLVRTTAWVLRFARRCRKQRSELEEYGLTATECEAAENLLVRQALLESFPDEMRSAERGKDVASSSEIRGLTPYVDENGLLRVYGRDDAELFIPYSARRPVILSHRHSLTEMVVRHFHDQMKHQNVDATIAQIRTRFWVKKMRRLLKEVISSCNECKLQRTRPMPPIMGPLPVDRLKAGGWPFKYTGLDYFGRLLVTVARHRKKRWVALFTCLTTRAIQLRKLAHDLSTDSCIIAAATCYDELQGVHRSFATGQVEHGEEASALLHGVVIRPDPAMCMASARPTDAADCITVCYMERTKSADGRSSEVASGDTTEETSSHQFPDAAPTGGEDRSQQSAVPRNSLERRAPQPAEPPVQRNLSIDAEGGRLLFRILPVTLYGAGGHVRALG